MIIIMMMMMMITVVLGHKCKHKGKMGACIFYVHITYYQTNFYVFSAHSLQWNEVIIATCWFTEKVTSWLFII